MQIGKRHGHIFGKAAVRAQDAHDLAGWTVALQTTRARLTAATAEVDLGYDALTHPFGRSFIDLPHKLMPRHPPEVHIAFEYLQIGRTHPGQPDAHQRPLSARLRDRMLLLHPQSLSVPVQRAHNEGEENDPWLRLQGHFLGEILHKPQAGFQFVAP